MILSLAVWAAGWGMAAAAPVEEGFEPETRLISPDGTATGGPGASVPAPVGGGVGIGGPGGGTGSGQSGSEAGRGLFGGQEPHGSGGAGENGQGGLAAWVKDRAAGLWKGIGAGLLGAAVAAGLTALFTLSVPVLLVVGGAALVSGALYGLVVGGRRFNWVEAVVGSVIGGISAGVGGWLAGLGGRLAARVGIAATNIAAGGASGLVSYLVHSPERSVRGAVGAFALGSLASGLFMGLGALTIRFWTWRLGTHAPAGDWARSRSMVAAALAEPDPVPGSSAAAPGSEIRARVLRNVLDSRRAREASRFRDYLRAEAEWEDIARWRATHGYQYDVFREGPLGGLRPGDPARNFYGMRYNEVVLPEDRVLYRAGGENPLGRWFTFEPPVSEALVRVDTAVKPVWVHPQTLEYMGRSMVEKVYAVKVPKGTVVYVGPVASQGGPYLGGEHIMQVYIPNPWAIEGLQVVDSWRIVK